MRSLKKPLAETLKVQRLQGLYLGLGLRGDEISVGLREASTGLEEQEFLTSGPIYN